MTRPFTQLVKVECGHVGSRLSWNGLENLPKPLKRSYLVVGSSQFFFCKPDSFDTKGFRVSQQEQQASEELNSIFVQHPVPWGTVIHPNGLVQVCDARMVEIPIFVMTKVLETLTSRIATQKEVKAAA